MKKKQTKARTFCQNPLWEQPYCDPGDVPEDNPKHPDKCKLLLVLEGTAKLNTIANDEEAVKVNAGVGEHTKNVEK